MEIKGLIFDCDGTLADTMPLHWRAWQAISEKYKLHFPQDRFYAFGGVPSHLHIPLAAITAFADPYVGYGLRFRAEAAPAAAEPAPEPEPTAEEAEEPHAETPQVVSLDSFRRRTPPKAQE